MKKCCRTLLLFVVIGIICYNPLFSSTRAAFQVEVGQEISYEIKKSKIEVEFDILEENFKGFKLASKIFPIGETVIVNVTTVNTNQVNWKALAGNKSETYNIVTSFDLSYFFEALFFISSSTFTQLNPNSIYSSGTIPETYLRPILIPPILDAAPTTWDYFDYVIEEQESLVSSLLGFADDYDYNGSYEEMNEMMTFTWGYNSTYTLETYSMNINSYTTFRYNRSVGLLESLDTSCYVYGEIENNNYIITMESQINQLESEKGVNFAEFFANNKWYIIGGGGGLVAVAIIVSVILVIQKKKG
ncbi:MAG: hypothetical protein GF308_18495 [Candidatus Heimdallarchaeota archaeon]|nr:hypothetical protein [Candidatus Heimdallarchaeota archaeon]